MTERVSNVTVVKNIVVSTLSYLHAPRVGEKGSDLFRWTVRLTAAESLLLDAHGQDAGPNLAEYIKSVEFVLHQTFTQPRRVLEQPPYEVTEIGWGEFELIIRINFQDTQERPVELRQQLKLRPDPEQDKMLYDEVQRFMRGELPPGSIHPQINSPVVRHTCDQLVFYAPHEWFYEKLKIESGLSSEAAAHALLRAHEKEDAEFEHLAHIHNTLRNQLAMAVEELMAADWDIRREKEKDNISRSSSFRVHKSPPRAVPSPRL